jgi:hypothetical protein
MTLALRAEMPPVDDVLAASHSARLVGSECVGPGLPPRPMAELSDYDDPWLIKRPVTHALGNVAAGGYLQVIGNDPGATVFEFRRRDPNDPQTRRGWDLWRPDGVEQVDLVVLEKDGPGEFVNRTKQTVHAGDGLAYVSDRYTSPKDKSGNRAGHNVHTIIRPWSYSPLTGQGS